MVSIFDLDLVDNKYIVFHCPESGDYTVATLNGKEFYRGYDSIPVLLYKLLEELGVEYENVYYPRHKFEHKFGQGDLID